MDKTKTSYDHSEFENKWLDIWEKNKYFQADPNSPKPPYTILMPPPNVTAKLHMGHGLGDTIQDIYIRWKRMSGYDACWLPGTDHAGIATQMMAEKQLKEEGQTKEELGREAFLEYLHKWKEKHGGMIVHQIKKMGYSCDWSREAYTFSPKLSQAVRKIFVHLYEKGLIYRGNRLVNWDSTLQTAVSDDEVNNVEKNGKIWHLRYPLSDGSGEIIVATTRPETMLGDTAVAVHPDDERYKELIGKTIDLPLTDRKIPIIADDYVKMDFGSGAVKITPAHDFNDFEMGQRHQLKNINILNKDGTLNEHCPEEFRGLDRFVARKEMLKKLKAEEFLVKEAKHKMMIPVSDRSKDVIEPRLSKQWYVKMKGLAKPAIAAAENDDLKFYPDSWKKTYLYWLSNIQDWCISRQLWWGHQIPIWHCNSCEAFTCDVEDPNECSSCKSTDIYQDEDVLDTWFSSWLWPISPFGWPEEINELERFYPSNVLVTGAEIIFLWVARMVMLGLEIKGELPFKDVYFNAIVCDKKGQKFSKTLGNGIDPLEMSEKYGADATRFTVISLAPLGGRVSIDRSDFENGAKFINKIWNAFNFIQMMNTQHPGAIKAFDPDKLSTSNKWLLHRLGECINKTQSNFEKYRLNDAVEEIYQFIWGDMCDWAIETTKIDLKSHRHESLSVLNYVFEQAMLIASPIIPFISEEITAKLEKHPMIERAACVSISDFPIFDKKIHDFEDAAKEWAQLQELTTSIRAIRAQLKLNPKEEIHAYIKSSIDINVYADYLKQLAKCSLLDQAPKKQSVQVGLGFEILADAGEHLDVDAESKRIEKETIRINKILGGLEKKLGNKRFIENAQPEVIQQTKDQKDNLEMQLLSLKMSLQSLKN